MPTSNQPNNGTLILEKLDIPGRTGPVSVSPEVWGLGIAAVLDNFPQQGLHVRAGPWGAMNPGDLLKIFYDGQVVLQKTLDQNDVNKVLQLFVNAARISEGRSTLSYSVKRVGQAEEPSEDLQVLVKLSRPGGHDDNSDPGHSKLIMRIPQDILDGGIDKDNIAAGVSITIERYPDIAVGDVIQLSWGGISVLSNPLTQDQVDGKIPITVHVSEAVIREAGDSDGVGLAVVFEVYDQVQNRSQDWSVPQRVVVAIDSTRLEAPILDEALNNQLDLDQLLGPGTARVWVTTGGSFKIGDVPVIRIKGIPLEGAPIDIEIAGAPLISVPSTADIPVPNALLRQFAKSQFALSYRLKKVDGSADLKSKSQFISAIGEIQRLTAPIALDAVSGALDPQLNAVRIEIPFSESFAAGQLIQPFWLGTRPDLTPYMPSLTPYTITNGDIVAGKPLLIIVDGTHLTPINGGRLELYYQLWIEDAVLASMNTVNATHAIRESIHADILQIGEPKRELPEPIVAGVVDGTLPADTNGTTLTMPYLNTVKGDEVTYEWIGANTGIHTDSVTLNSNNEGTALTFTIKAEYIKGNEGGAVQAHYFIKRAVGGTSYSDTLEFRVGAGLESPLPVARLPQATGSGASVTLAPLNAQTGATVIVAYTGMNTSQNIQLTMAGKPGAGSPQIPGKPGSISGSVEFLIGPEALAANISNGATTFTLTYEVIQGNNKIPSLPLTVTVTALPATELDKLSIVQADGDVLDLNKVKDGATVSAGVWAFIKVGQPVWLVLKGKNAQGAEHNLVVWKVPGAAVNQAWIDAGKYDQGVYNVYFKDLADGTDLELHFKAALTSSQVEADAIVAPVKRYKVKAVEDVKPTISSVHDSKGVPIAQNGLTVDPDAMLRGTAAPGLRVLIYNNGVSTGGDATADAQGNWSRQLRGLALGECDLTAVAQYGGGPVSAAWKVIVTQEVTPTITSIKDGKGVEIPDGGVTVDTSVTISGKASKGQKVDVLDGTASKGKPPVDPATGVWTLEVSGLSVAAHSFTAKAEYGAGPVSAARTLTVAALATPTITSVNDPYGKEVPNGSTITNDNVSLTGTATAGLDVEIFDGTTTKGTATVNASGVWTRGVGGLVNGPHSLTAKGIYGSNPVSAARTFVVADALVPAITSVKDSKGIDIPQNGTTVDTSVTLTGTGTANRAVDIYDGVTLKNSAPINAQGIWIYTATGLTVADHAFKAKAKYGSETESPIRTFTVMQSRTEDWDLAPLGIIPFNSMMGLPSGLMLTVHAFTTTPQSPQIYTVKEFPELGRLLTLGSGNVGRFQFPGYATKFELEYFSSGSTTNELIVYGEDFNEIHREYLKLNNGNYEITKIDTGRKCSYFSITINATSGIGMTRITWLRF